MNPSKEIMNCPALGKLLTHWNPQGLILSSEGDLSDRFIRIKRDFKSNAQPLTRWILANKVITIIIYLVLS